MEKMLFNDNIFELRYLISNSDICLLSLSPFACQIARISEAFMLHIAYSSCYTLDFS